MWSLYPDTGCHCSRSRPADGKRLVMVVIVRAELRYFRDWVTYHHLLGVQDFVVISNECDENHHANLQGSVQSIPCSPSITFLEGFRCAASFQTAAYRAAVKALSSRPDLDPARTRVLFSDVDEFLVVRGGGGEGQTRSPLDTLFASGADNASMWTIPQTLFGSSFRQGSPIGFVPANFALAAANECDYCDEAERRELANHRTHKSICLLSAMTTARPAGSLAGLGVESHGRNESEW